MSEKKETHPGWRKEPMRKKAGAASVRKTQSTEIAPVDLNDAETDAVLVAVGSMGHGCNGVEELARGVLKDIGMENGELTERGLNRVKGAVKFLGGLLAGKKHKEAMEDSGLVWAQISSFILASKEFEEMYKIARGQMKHTMGMTVLETAFELATEGESIYKNGEFVGKKRSEKMLDRLMVLAGREFQKDSSKSVAVDTGKGGGITLNFHFDGKKNGIAVGQVETVDV